MYHSITFGEKNTWDDWHLFPESRPLFLPPEQKTSIIDIPGFDGQIDLSESLTKFPVYNNRKGSIKFIVMNDYQQWTTLYTEIMNYLHGRHMTAVLEDDKEFVYEGRFTVNDWTSNNNGTWSTITIGYDVQPYKLRHQSSTDRWKWDPFNFETGLIQSTFFANIEIDSDDWVEKDFSGIIGRKPVVPTFILRPHDFNEEKTYAVDDIVMYQGSRYKCITAIENPGEWDAEKWELTIDTISPMDVQLYSNSLDIPWVARQLTDGANQFYDYIFCDLNSDSLTLMKFKGHGTVSIDFKSGDL